MIARADVLAPCFCAASAAPFLVRTLTSFKTSLQGDTCKTGKKNLVFASQLALEMNCKVTGSAKSFLAPVECLFVFLEPV